MISQIEIWTKKLNSNQKIILVMVLLSVVFSKAMTAGESIGSALYYITH